MKIYFVGQSTFKLTLDDGAALLTDPWFSGVGFWRAVAPACGPEGLGRVDFVLASHNHLDHLDKPGLELARAQDCTVIGSERVAKRARKAGLKKVFALRPGEEQSFPAFRVKATPAFHPLAKDAIGFLIEVKALTADSAIWERAAGEESSPECGGLTPLSRLGGSTPGTGKYDAALDGHAPAQSLQAGANQSAVKPAHSNLERVGASEKGRRIYFCGDTRLDFRLTDFLQQCGPVDLAFLQISCAVYFGKDDGLRLETAAELARAVKPKLVVPMHYHGRFKSSVNPEKLKDLLAGTGIETLVIGLGEEKEIWK